jgi:hypothetical protein
MEHKKIDFQLEQSPRASVEQSCWFANAPLLVRLATIVSIPDTGPRHLSRELIISWMTVSLRHEMIAKE